MFTCSDLMVPDGGVRVFWGGKRTNRLFAAHQHAQSLRHDEEVLAKSFLQPSSLLTTLNKSPRRAGQKKNPGSKVGFFCDVLSMTSSQRKITDHTSRKCVDGLVLNFSSFSNMKHSCCSCMFTFSFRGDGIVGDIFPSAFPACFWGTHAESVLTCIFSFSFHSPTSFFFGGQRQQMCPHLDLRHKVRF